MSARPSRGATLPGYWIDGLHRLAPALGSARRAGQPHGAPVQGGWADRESTAGVMSRARNCPVDRIPDRFAPPRGVRQSRVCRRRRSDRRLTATSTPFGVTSLRRADRGPNPKRLAHSSPTSANSRCAARDLKMKPSVDRTALLARDRKRFAHCPLACAVPTLQITGAQSSLGRNTWGAHRIARRWPQKWRRTSRVSGAARARASRRAPSRRKAAKRWLQSDPPLASARRSS